MSINIRFPNITGKTEAEQLVQVRSYLHQLVGQLNWLFSVLESGVSTTAGDPEGNTIATNPTELEELKMSFIKLSGKVDSIYSRLNNKMEREYMPIAGIRKKVASTIDAQGWYKLGTIPSAPCSLVTLVFDCGPAMADIVVQSGTVRMFLRTAALADDRLSKVCVIQEDASYGVYVRYNSDEENPVEVNVAIQIGEFTAAALEASEVKEEDMLAVITLKE